MLENITGKDEQKSIIVKDMTLYYSSGKTEPLSYSVTMNVTVTPLSFTQKWKLGAEGSIAASVGGVAGVTVGVAEVETNLAKAEISGSTSGTLSVEHSFEDGVRNLTLIQTYEDKIAAKAKIGPAAKASVLGQDLDIGIAKAGGGITAGKSVGIGLSLDNYNPNDTRRVAQIGTFMLGTQAQAGGDLFMLKLAEERGFDFWNQEQYGATVSLEGSADVGSIKFSDAATGTLASVKGKRTISYDIAKDKTDSSKELAFGYELSAAADVGKLSIANIDEGIFSRSDSYKVKISAGLDGTNRVEKFTVKKEEKSANSFLHKKGTVETVAITYGREPVEQIKKNIGVVAEFISGSTQYILEDAQQDLFEKLDKTPMKGSYSATKAEQESTDVKLKFGINMVAGLELGVDLEGVSSCVYETAGGTYESGKRYITNTNEIEAEVKENSYSINQLVGEPLKTAVKSLGDYLVDKAEKLKNGIENEYAIIKESSGGIVADWWRVHIVSLKKKKTRTSTLQSYEITAYRPEMPLGYAADGSTSEITNEYKVSTLGDPYYVYVTDGEENKITDYSDQPLTLKLCYTDEMLESAGLSEAQANNIGIYKYSEEFYGYVCVGGTLDRVTKAVSVEIIEPGQYVLAADSVAPTVKEIQISLNTNKPLITVIFDETSGFQEFSMNLDEEEVIGTADWNKYYNRVLNSFSYQVEKELDDGKHVCSVYAVDTAGNAMSAPYEMEWNVTTVLPESISLDKDTLILSVGETATLKAEIIPSTDTSSITWTSSNTSVASVENGLVTAISIGKCAITVSAGDKSATCFVIVTTGQAGDDIAGGSYENIRWRIDSNGKLTVEGSGEFANSGSTNRAPWFSNRFSIKSAEINLSGTTNASYMLNGCQNLTDIDMSNWDISKVTDMTGLFRDCSGLTSLDLSNLDVEKVTSFVGFFDGCRELSTIYVPCNLKMPVELPKGSSASGDIWYDIDGNTYTELPQNLTRSIVITRNQKPVISAPHITLKKGKTSYL